MAGNLGVGRGPRIPSLRLVHDTLLDAGIFPTDDLPIVPMPPPPPMPRPPEAPLPRTIYGDDFVNVCKKCGSTLIWDIRIAKHIAPFRAMFMNWFRSVILRKPPLGCLGRMGERKCDNYCGAEDE
jgi:hypothetical protein